jgi:hypothetical protein
LLVSVRSRPGEELQFCCLWIKQHTVAGQRRTHTGFAWGILPLPFPSGREGALSAFYMKLWGYFTSNLSETETTFADPVISTGWFAFALF